MELSSGLQKTNPASGREEDLKPGPLALTTRPRHLLIIYMVHFIDIWVGGGGGGGGGGEEGGYSISEDSKILGCNLLILGESVTG